MIDKVPFDSRGYMLSYPAGVAEWRPNEPFEAVLALEDYGRGRSSVTFDFRDEEGRRWPMFISDFVALVKCGRLRAFGVTERTRWIVRKRGQNYGLAMFNG